MSATISRLQAHRPNLDGGRPVDPLILALEGCIEGLVAERDDRVALGKAAAALHSALDLNALMVCSMLAQRPTRVVEHRARRLQIVIGTLMRHVEDRAVRLERIVDPELQSIVTQTDDELSRRRVTRNA
jgi:hypothetical protein